jgi:hypothetical protein
MTVVEYSRGMSDNTNLRGQAVRVFLGRGGTIVRQGTVLVDRGATLIVEYRTGGVGHERGLDHTTKIVKRDRVEALATDLCRAAGTRDRVCAAYAGHFGVHDFVPRTVRED